MQSSYDGSTHRQNKAIKEFFSSYDPLNPEHEAIGRVHWVKLTICVNILHYTDGWRVVDDDYGQAVGNPKRKV
jgi:hypothetical protein